MDRFNDRYRVASARLSSWNYSWNAAYFVTICTKDRECYFGQIDNQILRLNSLGIMAGHCWNQIPHHFPFVKLGQFIVMPNHVHGIIVIDKNSPSVETQYFASDCAISKTQDQQSKNKFGPQSGNLASVIRGFKIGVTKAARELNKTFFWQSRFHDHIIRDGDSWNRIADYIENNPTIWDQDVLYKS